MWKSQVNQRVNFIVLPPDFYGLRLHTLKARSYWHFIVDMTAILMHCSLEYNPLCRYNNNLLICVIFLIFFWSIFLILIFKFTKM